MQLTHYKKVEQELNQLSSNAGYMNKKRHPSFYLERTKQLFALLGNPETHFQYVHIGGTAGKGSVTIMTHAILKAAGRRVGSYLSPHVTTLAERTIVNLRPVSADDVIWAWNQLKPVIAKIKKTYAQRYVPSYFEAHFAMSMLLFEKYRVQWVVLEVGCGGAYDATNIIPAPRVSVITNVGLDHTQLLGRTRQKIAQTKAGIIKPGSSVVTGEADPNIRHILAAAARSSGCPFVYVQQPTRPYRLAMPGPHQQHNAAIAERVARLLTIPTPVIRRGLSAARLPARMEVLQKNPTVLLDGAHNPLKISALVHALAAFKKKRIVAIIGIGHNKQKRQMLLRLLPHVQEVIYTASHQDTPAPEQPQQLLALSLTLFPGKKARTARTISEAVRRCKKNLRPNDLLLITGSLYLAGEARELWIPESTILETQQLFP